MSNIPNDPHVAKYKAGLAKRAEATRAQKPKLGNLSDADAMYKPQKDGPMTIADVTTATNRMSQDPNKPATGLSQNTIEGMKALHNAMEQKRAMNPEVQPTPPAAKPVETAPATTPEETKRAEAAARLSQVDDLEFERLMRSIQHDGLNNDAERKAIAERVGTVDLASGIANNEFTQHVPIVPGKLEVTYRTVSGYENQAIRLFLFKEIEADPRRDNISAEIYSCMLLAAALVQVNTTALPSHLVGPDPYSKTFDEAAFELKYRRVVRFPAPLLHSLGIHGNWFDTRVRESLRVGALKNG